jgi:hypothetical protein
MTDSRALDADRLPWLTNDVKPAKKGGGISIVAIGTAALLLVAGGAYWAGRTVEAPAVDAAWTEIGETVALPQPRVEEPVAPAPAPVVAAPPPVQVEREQPKIAPAEPTASERAATRPERKVRTERKAASPAKAKKTAIKRPTVSKRSVSKATATKAKPRSAKRVRRVAHWPKPADAVPLGRIIRIGTYSTPTKNHKAWQTALRRYPQIHGLPKIIGVYRDKNGRTLYPLYIMTNARAQSDWLCRKMKRDWRRCTVIA